MKVFKNNTETTHSSKGESSTSRDITLDIVAGILIIRMILGHYMSMCNLKETELFYSLNILFFYMPWFFYKSGMFCSNERKEPIVFLKNNTKKFIIPFIFFSIIGTILAIISAVITDDSISSAIISDCHSFVYHGSTSWNGPLWFLISLFLVRVTFNYIRCFVNHYVLISLLLILALLHYLFLANRGIWWFGNFCSGLMFYILGIKLKELQFNKWIVTISIAILATIGFTKPTVVTMFGNFLLYDDGIYLLWYPFCLAGIIVFNNIVKHIGCILEHYHLDGIGHHSMIYYVTHYPLGFLVCALYKQYSEQQNNWELLMYLCLMWFGFLPILTYFFNTKKMSKFIGI